jgi:3-oxoacyl-[acyl-carrier-protein] synthase III
MDDLKKTGYQDRSKINMREPHEVQYWTKHLGVSKEQLQKAVDKVGNSAAAVKKELAA